MERIDISLYLAGIDRAREQCRGIIQVLNMLPALKQDLFLDKEVDIVHSQGR